MNVTRRIAIASVGGFGLAAMGACGAPDTVSEEAKSDRGYRSGDGTVRVIPIGDRDQAVTLHGTTLAGRSFDVVSWRGSVVVVNLWVSWCGPCHKEAPDFAAAFREMSDRDPAVEFIGINYRESSVETGRSQARAWGHPYDSVFDQSGVTSLQMNGVLSAQPSTAVLDRQGRVAAVALGAISRATLTSMIDEVSV